MAIKNALRLRVTGKQTSQGLFTLYTDKVESGKAYCFQDIVFSIDKVLEDGNSRARLYIEGHGYKHYLDEYSPILENGIYSYDRPLWLYEGERLALELDEVQANTTALMHIIGYWTDLTGGKE